MASIDELIGWSLSCWLTFDHIVESPGEGSPVKAAAVDTVRQPAPHTRTGGQGLKHRVNEASITKVL